MIKTNIKMRVTPEQSEAVQKICFANGIFFTIAHDKISYTEAEYLFIEHDRIWYRNYSNHNTGDITKGYTEVDASFFIRTNGTCVEETLEEELKQNINKEETMEKNEVERYKDVKEYLIAKGLYERVLEIEWEIYGDTFSHLFMWSKTEEGYDFWDELNAELRDLDIHKNIESLIQDYKAKHSKEFIKHLEAQPEEDIETKPTQKPKQYLCYVQGKSLPKHIHKTLEQAKQEAQRLCRKELTKVSVLEVVAEYEAEVVVKEL